MMEGQICPTLQLVNVNNFIEFSSQHHTQLFHITATMAPYKLLCLENPLLDIQAEGFALSLPVPATPSPLSSLLSTALTPPPAKTSSPSTPSNPTTPSSPNQST